MVLSKNEPFVLNLELLRRLIFCPSPDCAAIWPSLFSLPRGAHHPQQLWRPAGPLCFALTLQPIIEKIKEEVPNHLINVW